MKPGSGKKLALNNENMRTHLIDMLRVHNLHLQKLNEEIAGYEGRVETLKDIRAGRRTVIADMRDELARVEHELKEEAT